MAEAIELMQQVPFYHPIDGIVSLMPIAVFNILQSGFHYLSVFPGLEELETEFLSDPEVRAVLY